MEENYMVGEPDRDLYTYAMTKRMLYTGLKALNHQFGMQFRHLIPSTLYGPLFDRAEEIGAARRIGHAQEPAKELAPQTFDDRFTRRGPGVAVDCHPRGLCERRVEQFRDRAFRQRPRRFRFFGDRVEVLDSGEVGAPSLALKLDFRS